MERFIGRTVEIIYMDQKGKFSKRRIRIQSVKDDTMKAFCLENQSPRIFKIGNILAIQLVINRAS